MAPSLEHKIDAVLGRAPYAQPGESKESSLLELLREHLDRAGSIRPDYGRYLRSWPTDYRTASALADLPFLPVSALKAEPALALVPPGLVKRTLLSSSTTGQRPSRVTLDAATARRMSRSLAAIMQDFIGSHRRPYLVVDGPGPAGRDGEMTARGAAIQGLRPFATEIDHCLVADGAGNLSLDRAAVHRFSQRQGGAEVLLYGFTTLLWEHLVKPALAEGIRLRLPNAYVLHSGGWKRLQAQSVSKAAFNQQVAEIVGCSPDRVIDFYGMVENVGVVYPDCSAGNKHAPGFAEVIVRDPLTLQPVGAGGRGILQVCSILPTSFPGHLLLTDDLGEVIALDGCPCGRRGLSFRFAGRVSQAEARGCGNLQAERSPR